MKAKKKAKRKNTQTTSGMTLIDTYAMYPESNPFLEGAMKCATIYLEGLEQTILPRKLGDLSDRQLLLVTARARVSAFHAAVKFMTAPANVPDHVRKYISATAQDIGRYAGRNSSFRKELKAEGAQ